MASDTSPTAGSMSGLTASEAQAFHRFFMFNFAVFTGIALVAHLLVWAWRPWIPGEAGWEPVVTSSAAMLAPLTTFLT